jgi:alpha-glucuronidase
MNGMALEDVNACGDDAQPLESRLLANVTANVGPIFAKYAMTPYYTVCFDAPRVVSNVSSDPNAPEAEHWWKAKAAELYQAMPSLGGFLLKSDSEGNIGSHAILTPILAILTPILAILTPILAILTPILAMLTPILAMLTPIRAI